MGVRRKGAAALGLLLVVGCGASAEPTQLPGVEASPVALQRPPAKANADSPAGAAAFARYFYSQVTAAFASRSSLPVRELSASGCSTCARYIRSIDAMVRARQRATPVLFWIRFAESPADEDAATARVDLQYDAPASTRYDARGHVVFSEKPITRANHTVLLRRVGQGWKVQAIS